MVGLLVSLALLPVLPLSMAMALPFGGGLARALTADQIRGSTASSAQPAAALQPIASFDARGTGMVVYFDATASKAPTGRTISVYAWQFGDGGSDSSPVTVHAYVNSGRYIVRLNVTDSEGAYDTAVRYVSPAPTTVDIHVDEVFQADCPYHPYWNLRFHTYGDIILQNQVPCTDFQPWVLYSSAQPEVNPSWVDTLYRMDAQVVNYPGYSVGEPVILPVFNASVAPAPDSYIYYNFTFDYLDSQTIYDYDNGTSWPVNPKLSDGFGYLVLGNLTMDLQESKRIFGVIANTPAEAQSWWNANTKPGGAPPLVGVENQFGVWLGNEGNNKYDIYNGFQWFYESDIVDLNATVNPTTGQTTIKAFFDGWGWDVLMARWFYWGNTSYKDAVNAPYGQYKPAGWMPFERCWCENATISAHIRSTLDLGYVAVSEHDFAAIGEPGIDGTYGTGDDTAGWAFGPRLIDYMPPLGSNLPGASEYPNSELKWYLGQDHLITTPGSYGYGAYYEYLEVPTRWNMSLGHTLTISMPTGNFIWYDPAHSAWNLVTHIGEYATFQAGVGSVSVEPAGDYALWDNATKVLSVSAPGGFAWPDPASLPPTPSPYIVFRPNIDTTPPHTSAALQGTTGTAGWYLSDVTATLVASDTNSGVVSSFSSLDGGPWLRYSQPIAVRGSGLHVLAFYSVDAANNTEAPSSIAVRIDLTLPLITLVPVPSLTGSNKLTITWNGTESVSGIASYAISVDGDPFTSVGTATNRSITVADGEHTVRVRATSAAGSTATASASFRVDTSFFSFTGPYAGLLILLMVIAGAAVVGAVLVVQYLRRTARPPPSAPPPGAPPP